MMENPAMKPLKTTDRLFRSLVKGKLSTIQTGHLKIIDDDGEFVVGDPGATLRASVRVLDPRFYRAAALGGDVAVADAYLDSWWETPDLVLFFRVFIRNKPLLTKTASGWAGLGDLAARCVHAIHRNTLKGSRKNISAHYDLGNDLFSTFLDPSMMYSCASFPTEDATLEQASHYKNDRICRKLDLSPKDHLLEIGTGWGGFAIHAAVNYGCRVTTTTISHEQHLYTVERIAAAGLSDRIEVLFKDYRDLEGRYDKIVSIEMIEAVGHHYYDKYFETCNRLLEDDGLMLLQAITISDWAFYRHKRSVDFIKSHIFPGSCIPSITAISNSLANVTDMRIFHLEDIGPHYVRTLQAWRSNFSDAQFEIEQMGYDQRFILAWHYYLTYCEAGFAERYISDVHLLLAKPRNQRAPVLPGILDVRERQPIETA